MNALNSSFGFDIETVPDSSAVLAGAPDPTTYIDPPVPDFAEFKRSETRERKRAEYVAGADGRRRAHEDKHDEVMATLMSKSTLDASQSTVLCISYSYHGRPSWVEWGRGEPTQGPLPDPAGESQLLLSLWERCYRTQLQGGRVFTASSSQFDIRFCFRRSLALGVAWPTSLRLVEYRGARAYLADTFVDVCEAWGAGEYGRKISVQKLAWAFGVAGKAETEAVKGADFWDTWCQAVLDVHGTGVITPTDAHRHDEKGENLLAQLERYAKRDAEIALEVGLLMARSGIFRLDLSAGMGEESAAKDAGVAVLEQTVA